MPIDFENYDNSETAEATNALHGTKIIEVLVEGIEDIAFWHEIFKEYEQSHSLRFHIRVISYAESNKGAVLNEANSAGKYFLLCVDSDYDYLLCDLYDTPSAHMSLQEQDNINAVIQKAQIMKNNEFVFQTYAYAMENLKCFAESLRGVCVKATFNTQQLVDFPALLAYYSELIYELLLWNLLFYKKGFTDPKIYFAAFTVKDFENTIKLLAPLTIADIINPNFGNLAAQISAKIEWLKNNHPSFETEIAVLANILKNKGLEPQNAYLFMQGHCLHEEAICKILQPLFDSLQTNVKNQISIDVQNRKIEKTAIGEEYDLGKNIESKRKEYINLQPHGKLYEKVKTAILNNYDFKSCFLFSKIKQDIDAYINKYWA